MDANLELQRLKWNLVNSGYSEDEAHEIMDIAAIEISNSIADAVANALQQAEEMGISQKASDFLSQLGAVQTGNSFMIATDSGQTDFSEPPFPMLPRLLKNAKMAKDGSMYKRIPVRGKSAVPKNSYQASQDRQSALDDAKQRIKDEVGKAIQSPNVNKAASSYAEAYRQNRVQKIDNQHSGSVGVPEIRTASSKQNPQTQWVMPGKDADFTGALMDINANLRATIEEIIRQITAKYGA